MDEKSLLVPKEDTTTDNKVNSSASNVSLKSDIDPSASDQKYPPSPGNPSQAPMTEDSQDSEAGSVTIKDDDCVTISTNSVRKWEQETKLLSSPKPDVNDLDNDELVIDTPIEEDVEGEESKELSSEECSTGDKEDVEGEGSKELSSKECSTGEIEDVEGEDSKQLSSKVCSTREREDVEGEDSKERSSKECLTENREDVEKDSKEMSSKECSTGEREDVEGEHSIELSPKKCSTRERAEKLKSEPSKVEPVKDSGDDTPTTSISSSDAKSSLTPKRQMKFGIRKSRSKANTDMTPQMLEQLRLPFKHGWKREVVNRNVTDSGKKVQCDIYYFAPSGKKLRSMVEIDDWLKLNPSSPVQYKHFSFARMTLFEPPSEIVRDAGKPRNSLSLQTKQLKTTPMLPVKRQRVGLKLSSILPQQSGMIKITPKKPITINQSKSLKPKVQNETTGAGHDVFVKRPLIKRTKVVGHSFLKKRRLSPEWKPWHEMDDGMASNKHHRVILPKTPTNSQGTEEDDLQSILGTPSKLISSIVNPEPPKEIRVSLPPNVTNPPVLQVSGATVPSNVKVHIVRNKDATQSDILAQLGLTSKNVRMVNLPLKNTMSKPSDPSIVYLPAGQRPFKPPQTVVSSVRYQAMNSPQSVASVPLYIGPPISPLSSQTLRLSNIVHTAGSLHTTSLRPAVIPPPPPLALRPQFDGHRSKISLLSSHLPVPPRLQFASTPAIVIPDPPHLQMPVISPNVPLLSDLGVVTTPTDSPSTSATSFARDRSLLLQRLARKTQLNLADSTSLSTPGLSVVSVPSESLISTLTPNPLPSNSVLTSSESDVKSNVPTLLQALNCPVNARRETILGADKFPPYITTGTSNLYSSTSNTICTDKIPEKLKLDVVSGPTDDLVTIDTGVDMKQASQPSDEAILKETSEKLQASSTQPNGDDQEFHLPVSFGAPYPSSECIRSDEMDHIPNPEYFHCVRVSIHFSRLNIYCPISPTSSSNSGSSSSTTVCALEDYDNVFLSLPASNFRDLDGEKPMRLMLNGHMIHLRPGPINAKGQEDVKLKTTVKSLKEWVAKQSLKMKVGIGQKRKITLSACVNKAAYLRSFMLLQENYNIMMLIFKHLSIHDLLRTCRVCRIWRRMTLQKYLWRKLDLREVTKIKWIPAVNFFMNVDVRTLIMPEPLLSPMDGPQTLDTILDALSRMAQLKDLRFGTVSQDMLDSFLDKMPNLKSIGAEYISDADPDFFSGKLTSTASTEVAMTHAVELVLSGCFGIAEAATVAGVCEPDLLHLTQGKHASLIKLEQDSILLCCMRLCQMGFTIDHSVIEGRFQDAMKKRSSSFKMSPHTQALICQKMLSKNQHLFQTKLPYQPSVSMTMKLKAYISHLRMLYLELDIRSSSSVLAFVMKRFQVLNAAGNRIHCITALSVISPANLHLPIMLIFPVSISNLESYPGLILITSKEGTPTANLVTHYLRAVFDHVPIKPTLILFDSHEHLLSQELVSECVTKSVVLHCVPKELNDLVFPGNHGGILYSLSKIIGSELMPEKNFIDLISVHLKEDWFTNWQGMCRAFQITGTFPLNYKAVTDLYHSVVRDDDDSLIDKSDEFDDKDSAEIILSSEEDDEIDLPKDLKENAKSHEATRSHVDKPKENQEERSKSTSSPEKQSVHADNTRSYSHKPPLNEKCEKGMGSREDTKVADSNVLEIDSSREDALSVSDESEVDTLGGATSKRLYIHINEDEKENRDKSASPPRKKMKVNESKQSKNVSSKDSIIETIDAVISSSRSYDDSFSNEETPVKLSLPVAKKKASKEKKMPFKPSLKIKLSSKGAEGMVSIISNEEKSDQTTQKSLNSNKDNSDTFNTTNSDGQSEDEKEVSEEEIDEDEDVVEVSEEEIEEEDTEMAPDGDEEETNKSDVVAQEVEEETYGAEESDVEANAVQSYQGSPDVYENEIPLADTLKKQKKKKKKRKNKKNKADRKKDELAVNGGDSTPDEKFSGRKKKKKKRQKDSDAQVCTNKEQDENSGLSVSKDEALFENKDSEKTMMLMRRISLADHDYDAKFDSDSGHEIVEENVPDEEMATDVTKTMIRCSDQGEESRQEIGNLSVREDKEGASESESSQSSTDSDSSKDSGSSTSGSGSSGESGSETSDSDEEDASDESATAVIDPQKVVSANRKNEDGDCQDSGSESEKEDSSSSNDEQNQSEDGEGENVSEDDDDEENEAGDEDEENQSEDEVEGEEVSGESDSKDAVYSDDDEEEEESGGDDDSKCQLCMSTNPPHSKDQIIDWVDCDRNCGRWFHIICIQRSQSKGNPKHFVCPSCRCKR